MAEDELNKKFRKWEKDQNDREKRAIKYEKERMEREEKDETTEERFFYTSVQYMASQMWDVNQVKLLETLLALDDAAMEAELQLLDEPILESMEVLRAREQKADREGSSMLVDDPEDMWLPALRKKTKKHLTAELSGMTYAHAVKTRSATADDTSPSFATATERSPARSVHWEQGGGSGAQSRSPSPPPVHETRRRIRSTVSSPTPSSEPVVAPSTMKRSAKRRTIMYDNERYEAFTDHDDADLPPSFPSMDLGAPTPGTTDLDDPPEVDRPPPPAPSPSPPPSPPREPVRQPSPPREPVRQPSPPRAPVRQPSLLEMV